MKLSFKGRNLFFILLTLNVFLFGVFLVVSYHSSLFSPTIKDVGGWIQKSDEGLIEKTLQEEGLDAAFTVIAHLSNTQSAFGANCHSVAHKLGEAAYSLFSQGEDITLSPKTAYCGYGFYHGFMEKLLHETADMAKGRAFCEYADKQLAKKTSDAKGACFHGIGHGAVDDVPSRRLWGDPQAIVDPALALCEKVSVNEDQLFRCASGAFNALEIISTQGRYGLSLNKEDPFWICKTQPERYKEACFTQMVVAAMNVAGNDFDQSVRFIDTIKEDSYAIPSLATLVVERVRLGETDYAKTLLFCRALSEHFRLPCVSAFAEGFMKYGPPEQEYLKALEFCHSELLKEEEQKACFERILSILRIWYPREKSKEICLSVPKEYRWRNCHYN